MRIIVVLLLVAVVGLFLLAQTSDGNDRNEQTAQRFAIVLFGFFNNENRKEFTPAPIEYASVNLQEAHKQWANKLRSSPVVSPASVLTWDETLAMMGKQLSDPQLGRGRLMDLVGVLNTTIQQRSVPVDEAVALKPFPVPPETWHRDDRLLIVIGLETFRDDSPSHALTSVLGCFWFTGEGSYAALLGVPYDFTNLDTEGLVATMDGCIPGQQKE